MTQHRPGQQEIEIDAGNKLVVVKVSGFFTADAAHAATWETRRAIQSLGPAVGEHVTLYDLVDAAPSTPETVELIRMGFANPIYRPLRARKVAFCARSPLMRRQVERIRTARPDIGIFKTREAARAWLLARDA